MIFSQKKDDCLNLFSIFQGGKCNFFQDDCLNLFSIFQGEKCNFFQRKHNFLDSTYAKRKIADRFGSQKTGDQFNGFTKDDEEVPAFTFDTGGFLLMDQVAAENKMNKELNPPKRKHQKLKVMKAR